MLETLEQSGACIMPLQPALIDGPWSPGIQSELPRSLLHLSTMFRPDNVSTSLREALELADFCGLSPVDIVAFRAERLAVHEILVRVTADLTISDGSRYEDLGINFRNTASLIHRRYVEPRIGALRDALHKISQQAYAFAHEAVTSYQSPHPVRQVRGRAASGIIARLGIRAKQHSVVSTPQDDDKPADPVARWRGMAQAADEPLQAATMVALADVAMAILRRYGKFVGTADLIARLVADRVSNGYGSRQLGRMIAPWFDEAVASEGLRRLPVQAKPIVMNVKGASAAGKSTMRPLQKRLAHRIDVPWEDFALISPDVWRKYLLDYASLGQFYKYAGTMTGHELEIIDRKLDTYMADKASRGAMSHLLIDRFRFDSFVAESEDGEASKLLTRFGDLVYMYFVITPPEATVERAWQRGLKVGRYKSVDDLLAHNVEAFTGMPQLFFTWALRKKKRVHYEFLDNSVAEGEAPRTIAFGWNGEMNVLDLVGMLDIERFRKIDINAKRPEDVYPDGKTTPQQNCAFLIECIRRLPAVNLVEATTGRIYARFVSGRWAYQDERFASSLGGDLVAATVLAVLDDAVGRMEPGAIELSPPLHPLSQRESQTLGAWGGRAGGEGRPGDRDKGGK